MSAPVGGAEWNVSRTEWNVHGAEWNVHAGCQHPSETKSLTLGGHFSSFSFIRDQFDKLPVNVVV